LVPRGEFGLRNWMGCFIELEPRKFDAKMVPHKQALSHFDIHWS
jgi:hypothetical protein